MKYNKEKQICYFRRKGTKDWKICNYPRWFDCHEYKIENKSDMHKVKTVQDNFVDSFAKLDRAI